MNFRRFAIGLTVGVIALAPSAAIAAKGGHKADHAHTNSGHGSEHKAAGQAKANEHKAAAHARRDAKKALKDARFTATGTLVSVDGDTLTVSVQGGNRKALKGTDATFTVAEGAKINRDDAPATLADLVPGDHVMVKGSKDGETLVAGKVNAESAEADEDTTEDPTEDVVTPDPTEDVVTPDPTEDVVTPDPTEDVVTPDPTEDVVTPDPTEAP